MAHGRVLVLTVIQCVRAFRHLDHLASTERRVAVHDHHHHADAVVPALPSGIEEDSMLVYRVGYPDLLFANAADAAGVSHFIRRNVMGNIDFSSSQVTAFLVRWRHPKVDSTEGDAHQLRIRRGFTCIYKECNEGKCQDSTLPNNLYSSSGCAFGTLPLQSGGHWFSFEGYKECNRVDSDPGACYHFETLQTLESDVLRLVRDAPEEQAGITLQNSFGPKVKAALAQNAFDDTTVKKSITFNSHMLDAGRNLPNGKKDNEDAAGVDDDEWDDED